MNGKQLALTIASTVLKIAAAIVVVFFVYKIGATAYDYGYRIFAEPPVSEPPGNDVTIVVNDEKDIKDIAEMMETRGLIRDSNLFVLQEMFSEYHGKLQNGAYTLNSSMTAEEMLAVMACDTEDETQDGEDDAEEKDSQGTDTDVENETQDAENSEDTP